ncbi:hypothetical protein [Smaragdicoccus niigatensis]|uniref:hypothetical protein n=1 Tax=Smaragdicoccus niigatensis TaxID=359359 RepID=UPI000377248D|nr:hypothetical protein [Smaragdicoccus niigatensis]
MFKARSTCLLAVIAIGAMPLLVSPATAAPIAPAHRDLVLGTNPTGLPDTLEFPGQTSTQNLSIPVPEGVVPTSITATVDMPALVDRASIDVLDYDRLIARVDLPLGAGGPVTLPLAGVNIENHMANVTLKSTVIPFNGYCVVDWRDVPLRLHDPLINYSGNEAQPTVIADFLPPTLQKLTLYVPKSPTQLETQAAMQVATAIVAEYRQVTVDVHWLEDQRNIVDHPPAVLERQIAIREGKTTETSLTFDGPGPLLTLSGQGAQLGEQVRLLTSDLRNVVVAPLAAASGIPATETEPSDSMTLTALGQRQLSSMGSGRVSIQVPIDQSRIGRSSQNVTVRLKGNHTPLPASWGGRVSVTANGTEIDSWRATDDGKFDRIEKIPNQLLTRSTTLRVSLEEVNDGNGCDFDPPVSLVIDGGSEVTSESSDPPLPAGFGSLPQALLPDLTFGLADGDFKDAWRAVSVAAGLQRLTSVQLIPKVESMAEAIAAHKSAVLIAANGVPDVSLPLRQIEKGQLDLATPGGDSATVKVTPGMTFASLQTMFDGTSTILALSSLKAPDDLDALVTWLNERPSRWQRLTGDVLFKVTNREPEMLSVAVASSPTAAGSSSRWLEIAIGAGVLVLGGAVAAGILFMRRRGKTGAEG